MRLNSHVVRTLLGLLGAMLLATAAHAGPKSAARPWVESPASSQPTQVLAPPNDTCAGAIVIPCGTFNLVGDTSTATNDYTFPSDASSCTGFIENGKDVVYRINAMAGDSLWIDISSISTDVAVYIITNCSSPSTSCVAGEDSTDVGGKETLRYKFPSAGIYYLIVDSFGENVGGGWNATGQLLCVIAPPPPANDNCTTPTPLACGAFSVAGTTEFGTNDYFFPTAGASCFNSIAGGRDVVYRLDVDAGDSLWVNYNSSSDAAIYVLADCSDPSNTCVTGADVTGTGQTEQLRYRFTFGGIYYLVLDSKATNSFGTFTANGEVVCPEPPKNDICERSQPIPCGNFSLSGSTALANDNYTFNTDAESCTGYRAGGRDVVYHVYATAGDSIWIDYHSAADGSIYIVSNCSDATGTCVAGEDSSGVNETETLRYKFTQTGTYYIILDSFGTNTGGAWTMVGRMNCPHLGVSDETPSPRVELGAPSPNPFRSSTTIPFALPLRSVVTLRLLDLQGRVVRTLADGSFEAGHHQAIWDGRDDSGRPVHAGMYFAKITTNGGQAMRRAIVVR